MALFIPQVLGASASLGAFRFSLAMMVLAIHFQYQLPIQLGRSAVQAFFCISGFLITMVASERYVARPFAFLANRFLRIYPTYWACLALALVITIFIPNGSSLHPALYPPHSLQDIAANFAIFGLTQNTPSRLLPAAWSLHTELWFYLVIGLITATRPRLTVVLLVATSMLAAAAAAKTIPVAFYGTPLGNGFAFFIGSAAWHFHSRVEGWLAYVCLIAGFSIFEILAWMPRATFPVANIYLCAPAAGLFLLGLWNSPLDAMLGAFRPAFAFLGRLSYPVFLLHWPLGLLVSHVIGIWRGWTLLILTAGLSMIAAVAVWALLERPLERRRAAIRHSKYSPVVGTQHPTSPSDPEALLQAVAAS